MNERRPAAAGSVLGLGGGAGAGIAAHAVLGQPASGAAAQRFSLAGSGGIRMSSPMARSPERSATMTFGAFPGTMQIKIRLQTLERGLSQHVSVGMCVARHLGHHRGLSASFGKPRGRAGCSVSILRSPRRDSALLSRLHSALCTPQFATPHSGLRIGHSHSLSALPSTLRPPLSARFTAEGRRETLPTRTMILVSKIAPTSGTPRRMERFHAGFAESCGPCHSPGHPPPIWMNTVFSRTSISLHETAVAVPRRG